ncbi:hypothetical protein HOD29_01735 [archaeon]|jgi:hypothetical protein|nr:hypothetical protein [archaeon]
MANLLQHPVMTDFIYPFLLVFFILFAILEKTKLFGSEGNVKQLNALVSLVIGLIFVSAIFPKVVLGNLMLFLVLALVIAFVGLLLWGFITGGPKKEGDSFLGGKASKWFGGVLIVAIVIAVIWATGLHLGLEKAFDWIFNSSNSGSFWTNFFMVAIVVGAIAMVLGVKAKTSDKP